MLKLLEEFEALLPELLKNEANWNSLLVDYETPHVYRLWRQMDDEHRLMLHRIMPCDQPFGHKHPWPSAIHILEGSYEMAIGIEGCGDACYGPNGFVCGTYNAATMILAPGTMYEMLDPNSWHYVKPQEPSYSVMVIGKPWPQNKVQKVQTPNELSLEQKQELLDKFGSFFNA